VTEADFVCYASPAFPGKSGVHYFRVDGSGIIRRNLADRPSATDEAVGTAAN